MKLKASPYIEFISSKYSDLDVIKKKIFNLEDLYKRGHKYKKVEIDSSFPEYFLKEIKNLKNYIL